MTIAPQLYRTCNLTTTLQTDIFCGLQREIEMLGDCRVKRRVNTHFRQSQTKAAFLITGNLAVLRDGALGFTAKIPQRASL